MQGSPTRIMKKIVWPAKWLPTPVLPTTLFLTTVLLTTVLLVASPRVSLAYYPSMKDLILRITTRHQAIDRAIFLTRTIVFDPLGLFNAGNPALTTGDPAVTMGDTAVSTGDPGKSAAISTASETRREEAGSTADPTGLNFGEREISAREFHQRIYWIRGRLLAIETISKSGDLLHFSMLDEGHAFQAAVSAERKFSDADLLPPYLPFLSALENQWRGGMEYWGISPTEVNLALGEKGAILLKLTDGPDRAVYMNQQWLRPEKMVTVIAGNGKPQVLTIEFGDFLVFQRYFEGMQESHYPGRVDFLLDGRLFKQSHVLKFRANPAMRRFPLLRLRALAKKLGDQPPPRKENGN